MTSDTLLELVWADDAGTLDASAVHTVVARLRSKLGRDSVGTRDGGYRLITDKAEIDEEAFTELVTEGSRARQRGENPTAIDALRNALALWRGDKAYADISDDIVRG